MLLRRQREEYNAFPGKANLLTQNERTQVYGFDRSAAFMSSWAAGKTLDKSGGSGIMETRSINSMNIIIDKFTSCLEETQSGKIVSTSYSLATPKELSSLKGWNFDWTDKSLNNSKVYKLIADGSDEIQGLVALTDFKRNSAIYVSLAESAPHNIGKQKQYNGVGGHLFAIAVQKSVDCGYGGYVFMDAKNAELVEHYKKTLGALFLGRPHPYRMIIDEENAMKLLSIYTLKGE